MHAAIEPLTGPTFDAAADSYRDDPSEAALAARGAHGWLRMGQWRCSGCRAVWILRTETKCGDCAANEKLCRPADSEAGAQGKESNGH